MGIPGSMLGRFLVDVRSIVGQFGNDFGSILPAIRVTFRTTPALTAVQEPFCKGPERTLTTGSSEDWPQTCPRIDKSTYKNHPETLALLQSENRPKTDVELIHD